MSKRWTQIVPKHGVRWAEMHLLITHHAIRITETALMQELQEGDDRCEK